MCLCVCVHLSGDLTCTHTLYYIMCTWKCIYFLNSRCLYVNSYTHDHMLCTFWLIVTLSHLHCLSSLSPHVESRRCPSTSGGPSTREWVLVDVANNSQRGTSERLREKFKIVTAKAKVWSHCMLMIVDEKWAIAFVRYVSCGWGFTCMVMNQRIWLMVCHILAM